MSGRYQISFMPWAGLKKSVTLGPVTFWPYRSEAESRIGDPKLRSYLDRYFESYVDNKGESVDTITVCSLKYFNFLELKDEEFKDLREKGDVGSNAN